MFPQLKGVLHSLPLLSIKMELLVANEEGTKPVNYHNEEGVPCSSECVVAVDIERHSAAKIKVRKERLGEERETEKETKRNVSLIQWRDRGREGKYDGR